MGQFKTARTKLCLKTECGVYAHQILEILSHWTSPRGLPTSPPKIRDGNKTNKQTENGGGGDNN